MIMDAQLLLSDAQAVTADASATNVIDLGVGRNLFDGEPMCVQVTVDVAADATTGDETYEFELHTDDNASLSSSTELVAVAVPRATLAAGYQFVIPIPVGATLERYFGMKYDVGGTTPSITCTAALVPLSFVSKLKHYADNVSIAN